MGAPTKTRKRLVYYIPPDSYVEGHGYRVSIVVEGEDGYRPTGNWPYTGAPSQTVPYFWGHDFDHACAIAERENAKLGLTPEDVLSIVSSSIAARLKK